VFIYTLAVMAFIVFTKRVTVMRPLGLRWAIYPFEKKITLLIGTSLATPTNGSVASNSQHHQSVSLLTDKAAYKTVINKVFETLLITVLGCSSFTKRGSRGRERRERRERRKRHKRHKRRCRRERRLRKERQLRRERQLRKEQRLRKEQHLLKRTN
jgi:hypothetical protein